MTVEAVPNILFLIHPPGIQYLPLKLNGAVYFCCHCNVVLSMQSYAVNALQCNIVMSMQSSAVDAKLCYQCIAMQCSGANAMQCSSVDAM